MGSICKGVESVRDKRIGEKNVLIEFGDPSRSFPFVPLPRSKQALNKTHPPKDLVSLSPSSHPLHPLHPLLARGSTTHAQVDLETGTSTNRLPSPLARVLLRPLRILNYVSTLDRQP